MPCVILEVPPELTPSHHQTTKRDENKERDANLETPPLTRTHQPTLSCAHYHQVKRELLVAKDRLVVAQKSEVYNEKTGIGETLHGLPLGCISLKLIMMEGVAVSAAKNVRERAKGGEMKKRREDIF